MLCPSAFGQTAVDLGKQGKNIDFSAAPSTTPWKMGIAQPTICQTGEAFFNTSADPGLNLNLCINNQWLTFTGALGSVPPQTGSAGFYLRTNGSNLYWSNIVTGGTGAIDCASLPGVCDISTALVPMKALSNVWTGANDFTTSPYLKLKLGAGDPASGCELPNDTGKVYVRSDGAADNNLWVCESNSGSPRWRRPMDGVDFPAMKTVDQGHFWLGNDAGTSAAGTFNALQPRCWEFAHNWKGSQLRKATIIVDTADAEGVATFSIYSAEDNLIGQSNSVDTETTGVITFTFATPLTLTDATYTACLATTSSTVQFRASSLTTGGTLLLRGLSKPRLFIPSNAASGSNPLVMPPALGTRTGLGELLFPVAVVAEP